tara:strand:+ start:4146 stop:5183 length:1038 start_codon:yes stop_codon:yes gene_type:complete
MITYAQARSAFLGAARLADATLNEYPNPERGPEGEALAIDVACLGDPNTAQKLVLISGVHGVEGYAGSMIPTDLIGRLLPSEGLEIVLIHAVNPHGMAWFRRVTEEGVDLNRNFVDFDQPLPANPAFDEQLAKWLTPSAAQKSTADAALMRWMKSDMPTMRAAVAGGQYRFPAAPFFGGFAPTWARANFESILAKHVGAARTVCIIAFHTGLGDGGIGQFIGSHTARAKEREIERFIWGEEYVESGEAGTISYIISGDLPDGVRRQLSGASVIAVAHEFGTLPEMSVLEALRIDHAAAVAKARDFACMKSIYDAFFVCDERWKTTVIKQAREGVERALTWFERQP